MYSELELRGECGVRLVLVWIGIWVRSGEVFFIFFILYISDELFFFSCFFE